MFLNSHNINIDINDVNRIQSKLNSISIKDKDNYLQSLILDKLNDNIDISLKVYKNNLDKLDTYINKPDIDISDVNIVLNKLVKYSNRIYKTSISLLSKLM